LFSREEAFARFAIIVTYADRPRNLIEKAAGEGNPLFGKFVAAYRGTDRLFPEASCVAFLEAMTPSWEEEMQGITGEIEKVGAVSISLAELELDNMDSLVANCRAVIGGIGEFIAGHRKSRLTITDGQARFADFGPFLEDFERKLDRALRFANGESPDFVEELCKSCDKSVILHCPVALSLQNALSRFPDFAEFLRGEIRRKSDETPRYSDFLDESKRHLTEIAKTLAVSLFDKLNRFYFVVQARAGADFLRGSLAEFVDSMTGGSIGPGCLGLDQLEGDLLQAINSLRLHYASMGLPGIRLEAQKSGYAATEEDTVMATVRVQLKEAREIDEKIRDMHEAADELRKYSSICVKCREYCASYVCPFCCVFLHCILCVERGQTCPACRRRYEEPLLINKTCFFGKEFEIKMHRDREARERAETDKH
jgi:hypothetical protein